MSLNNAAQAGEREIVITRVFDAPREMVFDAWTDEEQLSKWWGPRGFTSTFQKFDMMPGGTWEFIMHGPDNVDYPNMHVIVEVVHLERIVFKHAVFSHFMATVCFEDLDGKTKLTYRTVFEETEAVFDKVKKYAVPGAEQTMDRLAELLANNT
ncbi:SRPBCC family protein [Brevibacillus sp. GCM10020057]|uniref:SRPBCC family protein n=1 Tax=Brevibacillus sp. GCM10020057 TaxID=3317327 RepID=UPI00363DAA1E